MRKLILDICSEDFLKSWIVNFNKESITLKHNAKKDYDPTIITEKLYKKYGTQTIKYVTFNVFTITIDIKNAFSEREFIALLDKTANSKNL